MRPLTKVEYEGKSAAQYKWNINEARRAGNPELDLNSDWVDYASAGVTGPDDLFKVVRPVLDAVLISQDILDMALRSTVNTDDPCRSDRPDRRVAAGSAQATEEGGP